jgi:glutamyl-tRNA synthetase
MNITPRVRFAPSPTGYLHVGGLRTALFNFLFARHHDGKFILRIEDTDRNRFVDGAVENLISTLHWTGLDYDEGPDKGGDYGPYIQSKRLDIYRTHAQELIKKDKAYYCFCSPERLSMLRQEQKHTKDQAKYDKFCLNLTPEEIQKNLSALKPYVIRLNVPQNQIIEIDDVIRGRVEFNSETLDDQVLIKSDGYPTYHLANVVDDHLMKITHVIRGEEWLSSTPKHILLYDFFGWNRPVFAHLPLLLNPDRSKLSKRQGDVAVEDYRAKGYLKEALINFVALLGWNAGDDKEFYYMNELIEKFSLASVNKAGAIFNTEKLNWLNAEHIRNKNSVELLPELRSALKNSVYDESFFSDEYLTKVIDSMKERITFVSEVITKSPYFFAEIENYDPDVIKKRWTVETPVYLSKLSEEFSLLNNPGKEDFENALKKTTENLNLGIGKLIHPLRLAVSGMGAGPGVYDILFIIGKEKTIDRIKKAIEKLS